MFMAKIRVAIAGVGNCASSLVQGVEFYKSVRDGEAVPGIMNNVISGYRIRDIEFSAAFDVNKTKVGKDLAEAVFAEPNCTVKFSGVPKTGVKVQRGPTMDGIGKYLKDMVHEDKSKPVDVVKVLKEAKTDILINYLPVGSEEAVKFYAEAALKAGCGFVNCIPVFIAKTKEWQQKFEKAGLPVVGDDIKSQVGATIVHRVLANLFRDRGVRLDRTMQLNVGGNTDFKNMLERERLESKKISKTNAVTSQVQHDMGAKNVHIGPSDYVQWLDDRKWAFIRLEGTSFGNVPLNIELKLEVVDSPNSAGVAVDAIRCCKVAMDRKIAGALTSPSAYLMKSPPRQFTDDEAKNMIEEFIAGKRER